MDVNEERSNRRYAYVVEGPTDEDRLKKVGCLFVIKTGGRYIRPEIIDFLREVHEKRELVLVLDPDGPGRDIRAHIERQCGECLHADADITRAKRGDKVGIAQMSQEDVRSLLKPYITHDLFIDENPSLEDEDLYELGLYGPGGKKKRYKLIEKYHIPYTSFKNVEDALLMLCIDRDQIVRDLEDD